MIRLSELILFIIFLSFISPALAQSDSQRPSGIDPTLPLPSTSLLQQAHLLEQRNIELLGVGAVEPEAYILGPGDLLRLEILGAFSLSVEDLVSADGSVTLDQLGTIPVAGLSLAEARTRVQEVGRGVISSSKLNLVLVSTRAFKVYVTGKVREPGVVRGNALLRVSEVIEAAGSILAEGSLRGITLRHRDGTESKADLLPFLSQGSLEGNPTVLDGDVVVVHESAQPLQVSGAVQYPGTYEFVPGDELGRMLRLLALKDRADSTQVWLERYDAGEWESERIALQPLLSGTAQVFLRPRDRILVQYDGLLMREAVVEVLGAVMYPGPHPIEWGATRMGDLVETAGGALNNAVLRRAVLARAQDVDNVRVKDPTSRRGFLEELSRMDGLESVVDLTVSAGPLLEPGDVVWIPRSTGFVQVIGQVRNPGVYEYVEGWGPKDYIDAAGGYGQQADKSQARVSMGQHGQAIFASDVEDLAPGDLLWVPEKAPRNLWETVRNATTVITSLATLYLLIREAGR